MENSDRLLVLDKVLREEQEELRNRIKEDGYDLFIDGAICEISRILELVRYVGSGCDTISEIHKRQAEFAKIREKMAKDGVHIDFFI